MFKPLHLKKKKLNFDLKTKVVHLFNIIFNTIKSAHFINTAMHTGNSSTL